MPKEITSGYLFLCLVSRLSFASVCGSLSRLSTNIDIYDRLSSSKKPFQRLVYPIPEPGGLGIHATIDLSGSVRFGPDVEWMKESKVDAHCNKETSYEFVRSDPTDFSVEPNRATKFYAAIASYWPVIVKESLEPDYSGIRPKLQGPDKSANQPSMPYDPNDFYIQGPSHHGIAGLINIFGIESPGLTSSLAIGDYIRDTILK